LLPWLQLISLRSIAHDHRIGRRTTYFPTSTSDDLHRALSAIAADPPQAISLFADGFAVQNRERIFDFTTNRRIPVISGWPIFAESGALCTYGPRSGGVLSQAGVLR
jgi:putative tryptophan/tyrosine transport system substrate-binding protein